MNESFIKNVAVCVKKFEFTKTDNSVWIKAISYYSCSTKGFYK